MATKPSESRARLRVEGPARDLARETTMALPKSYRTIEEFQREELRPQSKAGYSFDDLMQEATLYESDLLFDDQVDEYEADDEDDEDY
jgi:hypothetical protein